MNESSSASRSRLTTGCVAWPTRTTLAASVLRDSSVPPKRPSSAACRYSGSPSRYFDVITQASAASLSSPLGITCGGFGARRRPPSQHGQAYFTRSWRITRTCCGTMSSCSLTSTPISRSAAPSCGHTRSSSGSSWRTHLARQGRVQRLAAALGALVRRHLDLLVLGLRGCRLGLCAFDLGFVEEQVLLVRGAGFALGVEELALEAVELLLEQVAFGAHHAQLAECLGQRLLQRFEFFGRGHASHRRAFSSSRVPT